MPVYPHIPCYLIQPGEPVLCGKDVIGYCNSPILDYEFAAHCDVAGVAVQSDRLRAISPLDEQISILAITASRDIARAPIQTDGVVACLVSDDQVTVLTLTTKGEISYLAIQVGDHTAVRALEGQISGLAADAHSLISVRVIEDDVTALTGLPQLTVDDVGDRHPLVSQQ